MNDNEAMKVEITQDKLVDLLLHAATREDIAKLANDTKTDMAALEVRIDKQFQNIDSQFQKLLLENKSYNVDFDRPFYKLDDRLYRWTIASIIGTGIVICSFMIGLTSFIIKLHG